MVLLSTFKYQIQFFELTLLDNILFFSLPISQCYLRDIFQLLLDDPGDDDDGRSCNWICKPGHSLQLFISDTVTVGEVDICHSNIIGSYEQTKEKGQNSSLEVLLYHLKW